MPRADNNNVLVPPGNDPVCISGILHVCERLKFPATFVYLIDRFQVCLGVRDAPSSYVYLAADLDTLAVPDVRDALVAKHPLLLRPRLHVEQYDVVVVEQVQPDLAQLDFDNRTHASRDLNPVVKFGQLLHVQALPLAEVLQHEGHAVGFAEFLEQPLRGRRDDPPPIEEVRVEVCRILATSPATVF